MLWTPNPLFLQDIWVFLSTELLCYPPAFLCMTDKQRVRLLQRPCSMRWPWWQHVEKLTPCTPPSRPSHHLSVCSPLPLILPFCFKFSPHRSPLSLCLRFILLKSLAPYRCNFFSLFFCRALSVFCQRCVFDYSFAVSDYDLLSGWIVFVVFLCLLISQSDLGRTKEPEIVTDSSLIWLQTNTEEANSHCEKREETLT